MQKECSRRFCVDIDGLNSLVKNEKYILQNTSSGQDHMKIVVTVTADDITHAVRSAKYLNYIKLHHLFSYLGYKSTFTKTFFF